ncbi:hypothetical protein K8Q98_01650 [Candidatus Nomurabacteria bacterium]|nr:hypothetical protein [Candidatus Nomurabacteria bacterium]
MFKKDFYLNKLFLAFFALVLINIIFIFILIFGSFGFGGGSYSELRSIENRAVNFEEALKFFTDLAKDKGARYAFSALKVVNFQSDIDLHLLGHGIGDILYKQEGVDGMTVCDNDFRNACSHSMVIGLFNDKGEDALKEVAEACRKAPGGVGAYTMCFHGLGHGILAYEGYDMEKASKICQKTGTPQYNYNEATQCISGTVMEIIGGGFHDREIWEVQRKKYLNKNKPLSLCESSFISKEAKYLCYVYLTPYLFEAVGANLGKPTAKDFAKAFKFCDLIPKDKSSERDACFGGFGKEFDGLVQGRDIRQGSINNLSSTQLKQIYDWCLLASNKLGINSCVVHALNSLYWGGENERSVSVNFCTQIEDEFFQGSCFNALINAVSYYIQDLNYRKLFCEELPEAYQPECNKILNEKI